MQCPLYWEEPQRTRSSWKIQARIHGFHGATHEGLKYNILVPWLVVWISMHCNINPSNTRGETGLNQRHGELSRAHSPHGFSLVVWLLRFGQHPWNTKVVSNNQKKRLYPSVQVQLRAVARRRQHLLSSKTCKPNECLHNLLSVSKCDHAAMKSCSFTKDHGWKHFINHFLLSKWKYRLTVFTATPISSTLATHPAPLACQRFPREGYNEKNKTSHSNKTRTSTSTT